MSINEPLVSVIIPSYNHEKYISDCIDSIVNQTYKNIQLIIIDDGSTDNSPSIINKKVVSIKDCFGDIVFISNESNQGVLKSLNQALLEVRGEYISFCASDDKLLPSNIEMLSGFLSKITITYLLLEITKLLMEVVKYAIGMKSEIIYTIYHRLNIKRLVSF